MVRNGSDESYECSVRKIAFAAVVYELWHYRNLKVFLNILFPPAMITERIMADMGAGWEISKANSNDCIMLGHSPCLLMEYILWHLYRLFFLTFPAIVYAYF